MQRRTLVGALSAGVVVALAIVAAIVWPGLDAQETPEVDTAVWAMQADGRRYARVNTTIGELDTVRDVANPSEIVQTSDAAYLYSDSFSTLTQIDEATPADLDEEVLESSASTPAGTTQVATAGDVAAYLTDTGAVFAGALEAEPGQIDPFRDPDDPDALAYAADAIAIDAAGRLIAYSSQDGAVLVYDIGTGTVIAHDVVFDLEAATDAVAAPAVTAADGAWVLVDTDDGRIWRDGVDAVSAGTTGTVVVSAPVTEGDVVYLADETGLVRVDVTGSGISSAFGGTGSVLGTPATPFAHDGQVYAAWLPQGESAGVLWSTASAAIDLDYGGESLGDQRRPVFVATDSAVILNETRSGWVWTVPDGALVASSQDWSLDEDTDPETVESDEQLDVVIEPKPPVAEPDAFGVRAGALTTLPVLLNDHDPNEDVLTIDPESVTGLDPGFGVLSLTDDGQQLVVQTDAAASGSVTFSYAVSDGTMEDGRLSEATTVTLTVSDPEVSTAPAWCAVEGCLLEWPTPEVQSGGTVTVPVLAGWVDPEGDPLFLLSVENDSGIGAVAASPDGEVVYQHDDDGSGGDQMVQLSVTVSDTTGQTSMKALVVRVSAQPALSVTSFAVTDTVDASVSIDVAEHVTGTAGSLSLSSVRVLDDADATATVSEGGTVFELASETPGTYRIDFTVTDGVSEATGTVRVTLLASDAAAHLATAPVVAFVRPQEDATLDVFEAVTNPTRRVLLLSDVVPIPADGASLVVDTVAQNYLRVSGTTATGAPGLLGTVSYTVSDGTADEGSQVSGEASVYLLPAAAELAPIAVDDSVVVRAGAQIDIPVLDNDLSTSGERPVLDPSSVASSTEDALAFAADGVLRYLAPEEPGEYTVDYSVYTIGSPSLADVATVNVRVLGDEVNRAPTPGTLEGRVISGSSTVIDFDGYGADPDGDAVTLERIVSQPESGVATISPDGTSISYASVAGFHGQVSFRYRVVDASGESGEGTVRIGVLDAETNPSPVTFTDYVEVHVGEDNAVRVEPMANDVDPTGGTLALTAVRPDLAETLDEGEPNPEYARVSGLIASLDEDTVVIEAGTQTGTMSFLYDVVSDSGNTGRGLLVVKVVREAVPDYPVVSDTVLTALTRDDFLTGVDVLAGKATWAAGEVSDLEVSLWSTADDDVEVSGNLLRGELPATTRLIPFEVTAEVGDEIVRTYAFLRVPGDDESELSLVGDLEPVQVTELESATIDLEEIVAYPRGQTLQVGTDVRASGARADAACVREDASTVRYDAGAGAPWSDACQIPVRLAGQEDWTYLSVPVRITALDPQPELRTASITVGPGETSTYDLESMTTWQLREDWDGISYAIEDSGSAFTVSLEGHTVTVTGADDARVGSEESIEVSVTSHDGVAPARLIVRVGAAPSTLPQGGQVTQQCSQASGSSCEIVVVGAGGEVNPLPGTPLEVVAVAPSGTCAGVSFSVASATSVTATWTADAPGATCTATVTLVDAQGRQTNSERNARVLLDLQGYPKAPASVRQSAYGDGEVTLTVDPGTARQAYPSLTGFRVRSGGDVVAECSAAGVCPTISAPNGEQRVYEVWAVNAVGESLSSVRTTAWAYDTPATPTDVTWAPVVTSSGEGGVVSLSVSGIDATETGQLEISSATGETVRVSVASGQRTVTVPSYRVGTNARTTITITPLTRFSLPAGLGGSESGAAATVAANGVGAPTNVQLALESSSTGDGTSRVVASVTASANGTGSSLRYGIVAQGQSCSPDSSSSSKTFTGLEDGREYTFVACVRSVYEGTGFGDVSVTETVRAQQSLLAPQGYTFVVDDDAVVEGTTARWKILDEPESDEDVPRNNHVEFSGYPSSIYDTSPGIRVRYVHDVWNTASAWGNVTAAAGSAPYQVQASWGAVCVGGSALQVSSSSSNGLAAIAFDNSQLRYYDADGAVLDHEEGTWQVPVGAVSVERIGVNVDWSAQGWGLDGVDETFAVACDPNNPETETSAG